MTKIQKYIFAEILKGSLLVFFIFLSISWLLQFARLISLTNLIQVDILTILYLSIFLIPNLTTVIIPFVIIFGLIITFIKLHKDRELISIYSLGLKISSIIKPLFFFGFILLVILTSLNFYISPKIYKEYKIKEYEIRNKIDFDKITISNFIEINENTFLDFKKNSQKFQEVFIKFKESNDNMIYAEEAIIIQKENYFIFELINGFKITILENNKIEKLEFENYSLEIINNSFKKYDDFDKNAFDIFDDLKRENYINIFYKFVDSTIFLLIIYFFYINNIRKYNLEVRNILIFICFSSIFLIINQILKNSEFNLNFYIIFLFIIILSIFSNFFKLSKNEKNQ
tara:strand:+ start:4228 stop:5253 length:1026 start_codon:yes stop_codon:yes gene_type:complete